MTVLDLRSPRPDDAVRLLALNHAHQQAVLGRPDATLDDLQDALADPDLDPGSAVVDDPAGGLLGCALVYPAGDGRLVDLDVVVDPRADDAVVDLLLQHALARAEAAARARGWDEVRVDQGCYRQDDRLAARLRGAGFSPATAYHRLRRELDGPVERVRPEGVALERVDVEDEPALRRAHALHQSTFAGHFGFVPRPWEEWLAGHRARSGTGPLWFATADGRDVGFLLETDQFLQDEGAGYVSLLGVERAARGRGVARALLTACFAHLRERGRRAVLLHVDTANATGATALYESVGMRPVVVLDVWRCSRRVG